jgi:hypothetical protein
VLGDGSHDGRSVGSLDTMTGSLQREQPGGGDLVGQSPAVLEWEHRVRTAVDHQRGRGYRGEGPAGLRTLRQDVVVLRRGEVAGPRHVATDQLADRR